MIGLRVAAHNLDQRLWYIVFTNKGQVQDSAGPAGSVPDHGERAGLRIP